jgi:hypothetical protein
MSTFNPNEHLIQLKSKQGTQDYLEVKWRIAWFRSVYPHGTIDAEEIQVDLDREVSAEAYVWNAEKRRSEKVTKQAKGYARFRAIVANGEGGRATGTKSENAANFPDYIEKAESGAIGRALANLGFGTQFTGDELAEHDRVVDAPVNNTAPSGNAPITDQQRESIQKLWRALGKSEQVKVPATFIEAKKLIASLVAEYKEVKESRANSQAS